ncbi:bifunctional 4-hydroxy-3-methylbut-2-enyl diphosphate reductase/30S ribosomal protein S1 [Candidatus Formimonas warabiya]|uniref:4-hydroxy-3-methylbut-2-enyl diphosphate reductase n=1 Tax=Formimonas warabiya TaxID=1761012 RepID=A0A3G1KPN9_FORW1|nr:bifunctional 4-hydroxy-3-methylbut-2-enyl diphosphate reductase/30S ribosomal protein S1 [Candidatus Formimonas warabiya]ATW24105.1 4-hydroxy-3-methylbut-2-enyl diphosphate reductase [Candidatus Formimonas warabiya]
MRITVAENAGFCFGVKRALQYAEEAAAKFGEVFSLGPLIHNPQEVERLAHHGIKWVNDINEVEGRHVIIRSHGVSPEVFSASSEKNLEVIDATCPFVKRAQGYAKYLAEKGFSIVIVGDRNHPEVEGIIGWSNHTALVVESAEEAAEIPLGEKVGVIAQTTQPENSFQKVVEVLQRRNPQLKVFNTICHTTAERQNAAAALAKKVDVMFVIGGLNSANTKKLARISRETGTTTFHVEEASDIDVSWLTGVENVGITAGASTPDWIIEEVLQKMMEINEHEEQMTPENSNQSEIPEQELTPEAPEAEPTQPETSFAEAYDGEIKQVRRGERICGTVVQVRDGEVLVDVGSKSEGVIPRSELSFYEAENIHDAIKVGDQIEVLVLKRENDEGHPVLSKKRVDQEKVWENLGNACSSKEIVAGKVIEVVKGGLLVDVGVRGFVPASLVDLGYVEDLSSYVGKDLRMKIVECDRSKNKLVLSPKAVLEEELQNRKADTWAKLEEGITIKGVVRRLTNFGAFVDIGGVDGLLHVSEMAWYRVNHPSDVLKEGDSLEVYVLGVDRDHEKVSLGLKQLLPNPWTNAGEKYPVGSIVDAKVVRIAPFGAFVQVEPGIEGLVHISQLAPQRVAKTEDVVKPGDQVKVKVLGIDLEAKRMSLSIKEASGVTVEEEKKEENVVIPEEEGLGVTIGDMLKIDGE